MKLTNPHLADLSVDHFHHLGFASDNATILDLFHNIKFVCMSGSQGRVKNFAKYLNKELGYNISEEDLLDNLCLTDRYVMYKVGPILVANHGMGVPSLRIILNEIMKVLHYANATDVTFFRIGTSGGIGVVPGTVVITKKAVNGRFEANVSEMILGEVEETSTEFQHTDFDKITNLAEQLKATSSFDFVCGDTMCCDDFYEGQARLDGAFCNYTKENRLDYLQKAYDRGVRNIEMEASFFAAMTSKAKVNAYVVCVTLLNRLQGDQIALEREELDTFQSKPFDLVLAYIKAHLKSEVK